MRRILRCSSVVLSLLIGAGCAQNQGQTADQAGSPNKKPMLVAANRCGEQCRCTGQATTIVVSEVGASSSPNEGTLRVFTDGQRPHPFGPMAGEGWQRGRFNQRDGWHHQHGRGGPGGEGMRGGPEHHGLHGWAGHFFHREFQGGPNPRPSENRGFFGRPGQPREFGRPGEAARTGEPREGPRPDQRREFGRPGAPAGPNGPRGGPFWMNRPAGPGGNASINEQGEMRQPRVGQPRVGQPRIGEDRIGEAPGQMRIDGPMNFRFANEKPHKVLYLGLELSPVTPALREQLTIAKGVGMIVDHVADDSPAKAAGIKKYDILELFDTQLIIDEHQLQTLIAMHKAGDEVKLTVIHQGQRAPVTVKIAEKQVGGEDGIQIKLDGLQLQGMIELREDGGQIAPNPTPRSAPPVLNVRPAPTTAPSPSHSG